MQAIFYLAAPPRNSTMIKGIEKYRNGQTQTRLWVQYRLMMLFTVDEGETIKSNPSTLSLYRHDIRIRLKIEQELQIQ